MRKLLPVVALILAALLPRVSQAASAPLGFTPAQSAGQLAREAAYDASLKAENLRKWSRDMTTRPHHLGSPKAKENAEFVASLFRKWGYETEIEVFHVLFPTPKTRELSLIRPYPFKASLTEKIVAADSAAAALEKEALPPYNAYSGDGEVVGALVYVNQGLPSDYEVLERHGIDVKGKIAIARYGGSWRGIKVKVAAEKGAIGCIIYNDPMDDGYTQGGAYPNGAYKHDTAVQRGSVIDLPMRPGDPLTPNYGATRDAKRLPRNKAETIMKIPVLPISSVDAEPLLKAMDGPVAPADWRGALPLTYRLGGGKTVVRLKAEFNWDLVPTYNVIARMKGSTFPDQWVLRGNHHDAWVIGARDPISGLVPLLEQARAFSEMAKGGWKPRRTLVFCVWDGEEPGMLGSTEWVEHHRDELNEKAVAYINTDTNARGFLRIGGAHSIETVAAEVAHQVPDPLTKVSVSERLRSQKLLRGTSEEKKEYRTRKNIRIDALGSGSDYSAFLQHLGVASYYIAFQGEGVGGEYHTCFDTFDHYSTYIDPDYSYGVALAKMCGRIMLRLADADILPFDFNAQANTVNRYVQEILKLAEDMREETETHNRLVAEGRFQLAADPTQTYVPPTRKDPVPHINFAPLQNAAQRLQNAAAAFHKSLVPFQSGNQKLSNAQLANLNQLVYRTERALIDEKGLPRRPWFRHQIYAPGFYTGYGVKTIPGVREAIEERKWKEANEQIRRAADALKRMAGQIEAARTLIDR